MCKVSSSFTFYSFTQYLLIWEERSYTERKKRRMNSPESDHCDTTTDTENWFLKNRCDVIGIYGLRNRTNNKWYIGQSIDSILGRWDRYSRLQCKRQRKLYSALKKYGYDAFEKMVIEVCDNDIPQDVLDKKETAWIEHFNSIEHGYNLTTGGRAGKKSMETRRRMSVANTGNIFSDERKKNISRSLLGKVPINKGVPMSVEQRETLKVSNTFRKKLIDIYNLSDDRLIDIVVGVNETSRKYGINKRMLQRVIKREKHCHSWHGLYFKIRAQTPSESVQVRIPTLENTERASFQTSC